ncbi:MAG: STAS domain-containing protein [Deltaproteobacteria bacterium]|nr:STAS domain-containing protein [Deltaproteobacteria bacterium]
MYFDITVDERKTGVYVVTPEGRLDSNTYMDFEKRVTPLLVPSTRGLVIDMSGLEYISSAGVRVVLKAKKAIENQKGFFMMTDLRPQIKKVFDIINALPTMGVFRDLNEADRYLDTMQKMEIRKQEESSD